MKGGHCLRDTFVIEGSIVMEGTIVCICAIMRSNILMINRSADKAREQGLRKRSDQCLICHELVSFISLLRPCVTIERRPS